MAEKNKTNYVKGNAIFLYDALHQETCADFVGDIAELIMSKPYRQPQTQNIANLETPYDISGHGVIDVFIDSPGGDVSQKNTILTFLNIARSKGIIIRTTVTGTAASCASLIAIQGTPGFRVMYQEAYNMIHYGRSVTAATAEGEAEKSFKTIKERHKYIVDTYKKFTDLTDKEIAACMKSEANYFSAKKCLEKNMCDWVLTDVGTYIKRENKQR